jgi:hypothetical protein
MENSLGSRTEWFAVAAIILMTRTSVDGPIASASIGDGVPMAFHTRSLYFRKGMIDISTSASGSMTLLSEMREVNLLA